MNEEHITEKGLLVAKRLLGYGDRKRIAVMLQQQPCSFITCKFLFETPPYVSCSVLL